MQIDLFNYQEFSIFNSNFGFPFDKKSLTLRDSLGKRLGYRLFSGGRLQGTHDAPPFLQELPNSFRAHPSKDFALMERQFSVASGFCFLSGPKVRSAGEVAFLFKSLESEAIEHTFLLYRFSSGAYLVQHLSSGGISSAVVDLRLVAGNVLRLQPSSITLVHNHPSGQLISSPQDRAMQKRLEDIFSSTQVRVEKGIILNLRSGKFLQFSSTSGKDKKEEFPEVEESLERARIYRFDKQVFCKNYQPEKITSPEEAAAYIASQKLGLSDRLEVLCLNNASEIVGKFILPMEGTLSRLIELLTLYGGTSAILYGNSLTKEIFESYKDALDLIGFHTLDGLQLKSGNFYSLYQEATISFKKELRALYASKGKSAISLASGKELKQELPLNPKKACAKGNKAPCKAPAEVQEARLFGASNFLEYSQFPKLLLGPGTS